MAFIPTLACIQARIKYQHVSGILAENVVYHATSGAPSLADLTAINSEYVDWIPEALATVTGNQWNMLGVALRAMNEEEGLEMNDPTGFPVDGVDGSPQAPLSISYSVTLNTGLVGRSARGRLYGVGLTNPGILNGTRITDAYRSVLQGVWTSWVTRFDTAGYAPQVVSFVDAGVPRAAGRMLPITSVNVRFPLATQRGRLS